MHRGGGVRLHRETREQRALARHGQLMAHAVSGAEAKALGLDSSGTEIEEIEIRLLLEGIHLCYGYDFREYTLNPLRRGIFTAMAREHVPSLALARTRWSGSGAMRRRTGSRAAGAAWPTTTRSSAGAPASTARCRAASPGPDTAWWATDPSTTST